ncbi:uncharacterized protein LOC120427200 [Culex pipiens pallens]|uniref:uncharacterized protein LOC120427200 n=1 Tax=Culex pipiens pallens TaxID=42434 RepID=UPI001953F06D|nr:uncharacterized protein LOC120427200 [Culex pipiens pallens]
METGEANLNQDRRNLAGYRLTSQTDDPALTSAPESCETQTQRACYRSERQQINHFAPGRNVQRRRICGFEESKYQEVAAEVTSLLHEAVYASRLQREFGQQGVQSWDSFQADGLLADAAPLKLVLEVNIGNGIAIVALCMGAFVALVRHHMLQSQA